MSVFRLVSQKRQNVTFNLTQVDFGTALVVFIFSPWASYLVSWLILCKKIPKLRFEGDSANPVI